MGAPTGRRVARFHSRTVPSPEALASSVLSGLNATADTPFSALAWRSAPAGRPVTGFHSRTVPSLPPVASSVSAGLSATPVTPFRVLVAWSGALVGWPVAGFHSRTMPSRLGLGSGRSPVGPHGLGGEGHHWGADPAADVRAPGTGAAADVDEEAAARC